MASLALASVAFLAPGTARAQAVTKTAEVRGYSLTLKVLPAESFTGPQAEMARDGGAQPNTVDGPAHPNHHMVVFIEKDGKPVEQATVTITYKKVGQQGTEWSVLPVARMHVKGKGPATTHFGNNLFLAPGSYDVHVIVDGSSPADFHFEVRGKTPR